MVAGLVAIGPAAAQHLGQDDGNWYRRARQAEKSGNLADAYLYYSRAAVQGGPRQSDAWLRSLAIRPEALRELKPLPEPGSLGAGAGSEPVDELLGRIALEDMIEARRLLPPLELEANDAEITRDLDGDARELYEQVAPEFGLDVVFDGDFQPGERIRLRLEDADFRTALRILGAATATFHVPVSEKLFLVAGDTTQKRQDLEQNMAVVVPIPETVSVEEAQESARAIQQTMEIQKLVVDSQRRLVLMRDRVSKVRPAQALLESLMNHRPEVVVDVEFLELLDNRTLRYGLGLPTSFPVSFLGLGTSGVIPLAGPISIGMFSLTIGSAELLASMSRNSSRTLFSGELRSVSGQPATLKVGDRFPIQLNAFIGETGDSDQVFVPPPQVSFEDLGLVLEVTPYVHGNEEVTLEVNAEFKVLAGTALNGIPVIANRTFESATRMKSDQWAIMSGLMRTREAYAATGLAGLSQIPYIGALFRTTTRESEEAATLVVLKPSIVRAPMPVPLGNGIWTGTETKPGI